MVSWGNLWQRGFGWKAAVGSKAGKSPADGTTGFAGDGDGLNDQDYTKYLGRVPGLVSDRPILR